ncbi:unnamed protein product, partial [Ectocarpus sp. 8 AP-2014]
NTYKYQADQAADAGRTLNTLPRGPQVTPTTCVFLFYSQHPEGVVLIPVRALRSYNKFPKRHIHIKQMWDYSQPFPTRGPKATSASVYEVAVDRGANKTPDNTQHALDRADWYK